MTFLIKLVIAIKVLFWVAVITLIYAYSAEIGDFFSGSMARFDHLIGYEEQG